MKEPTSKYCVRALFMAAIFAAGFFTCGLLMSYSGGIDSSPVAPVAPVASHHVSPLVTPQHMQLKLKTRVVMFVPTPIDAVRKRAFVYRQFLREKWNPSDAIIVFVVGSKTGPRLEEDLNMTSIVAEQSAGIPIFVSDCRDYGDEVNNANGTSSTTCKVYEGVKYAYQHYDAEYLFRGADDAYVNLKLFFEVAETIAEERKPWWMGQLRVPTDHIRSHDLHLSKQPSLQKLYGMFMFGQYMLGCGYVFTWDVAEHIAKWTIPPHQTYAEDVIVGMWLNPFRIEKIHDEPNFDYLDAMRRYNVAAKKAILIHYVLTEREWNSIDDAGTMHVSDGLEGTFVLPPLQHFLSGKSFAFPVANKTLSGQDNASLRVRTIVHCNTSTFAFPATAEGNHSLAMYHTVSNSSGVHCVRRG